MSGRSRKEPVPPGWYQAPGETLLDRYWDGDAWTSRTRPRPLAGLQPASPHLVVHDSGRHPLSWVFTALGLALLIAGICTWSSASHMLAVVLATAGCLVLSVSTAVLRAVLPPRASAVVNIAVGALLLAAALLAALTVFPFAWAVVGGALVLVIRSALTVVRARR